MGIFDRDAIHDDDGISIIEALVSCVLIGLIAATAVPAFIGFYGGIKETKTENNAMNLGQAVLIDAATYERLPQGDNKCVPLLSGRKNSEVGLGTTHWERGKNLANVDLSGLAPAVNPDVCFDPTKQKPAMTKLNIPYNGVNHNVRYSNDVNPSEAELNKAPQPSFQLGNVRYTVETWIGECYTQPLDAGGTTCKSAKVAGKINHKSFKIITLVTWEGSGCSKKSGCTYTNSVALEADKDRVFYEYTEGAPDVTNALRAMCVVKNTSSLIDFLSNITANFSGKPVQILQNPSKGSLSSAQDIKLGRAVYRPTRDELGRDTIKYRVQNSIGTWSEGIILEITVKESCL